MTKTLGKPRLSKPLKWGLALAPFLLMVVVNETYRLKSTNSYQLLGISVINTDERDRNSCTWNCHNATNYCKLHHVVYLRDDFYWVDPIYFGIINVLMSTGNYSLANLVFLVILWPLVIYLLLLRAIRNRKHLKLLRNGTS